MRTSPWPRTILSALLVAALVPSLARPDEQSSKTKIQKHPAPQGSPSAESQTQTAPADKGKQPPEPGEAGILEVKGTVIKVSPERHAIIIHSTTNDYEVFVTPKSVLLRDGAAVDVKAVQLGDRVDSCRFNAKKAVQKMTVSGVGKGAGAPPPTPQ